MHMSAEKESLSRLWHSDTHTRLIRSGQQRHCFQGSLGPHAHAAHARLCGAVAAVVSSVDRISHARGCGTLSRYGAQVQALCSRARGKRANVIGAEGVREKNNGRGPQIGTSCLDWKRLLWNCASARINHVQIYIIHSTISSLSLSLFTQGTRGHALHRSPAIGQA